MKRIKYKTGFKQLQVLRLMEAAKEEGVTYTDIVSYVYELSCGLGTYSHKTNARGYWIGAFIPYRYAHNPAGWMTRLADHVGRKYILNDLGRERIKELEKKFPLDTAYVTLTMFEDIDHSDYPDYADAYPSEGEYIINNVPRDLSEEELVYLQENESEFVNVLLFEHIT